MPRKPRALIRCILLLALLVPAAQAQSPLPAPPEIGAKSYYLVDYHSGEVLAAETADARVEPASITKLMTSYIAFQELDRGNLALDEQVTISENAWRAPGSRMFLEVGSQVALEALLKGVIIQSGNDASIALAEHIAGSESTFASLMNQAAEQLGMSGTHYVNATGLPDPEHYTTAHDTAVLAAALVGEFPQYYNWYSEKEFTYNEIRQHNRNRLLWRDPSVDGLKTGHTESAGYCLVTSAMRDGMRLISVVMGTDSEDARADQSQALLNYGFRFFETYQLYTGGETLTTAEVWKGARDELELGVTEPLFVTIPRGRYDALEAKVELERDVIAPVAAGETLGAVIIDLDDDTVARRPLVALSDLEAAGWFGRTWDGFSLWVGSWFGDDD